MGFWKCPSLQRWETRYTAHDLVPPAVGCFKPNRATTWSVGGSRGKFRMSLTRSSAPKSTHSRVFKGATLLTLSRVVGYGLSFVRNIVLARMLTKADFGLSGAFATTILMLELSGRAGLPQLIIRSPRGEDVSFMASLQTLQLLGGVISAALLLACSQPMARLFGVPDATGSFAALALIPFLNSLWHLDNSRQQRELNFWPVSLIEVVPQVVITLAVWPVTRWLPDHRSIVVLLLARAVLALAVTHLLAARPFRLGWDEPTISESLSWAWPFVLSGTVVFASQQANQMVVGGAFSVAQLAGYSIASSLTSIPWFIVATVAGALAMPVLARSQMVPKLLESRLRLLVELSAVIGVLLFISLSLSGEALIPLLYGKAYIGCGTYMVLMSAGVALRLFGLSGVLVAMARGDSRNELYANVWRCIVLPLALLAVRNGGSPATVAGCALLGEAAGVIVTLRRLRRVVTLTRAELLPAAGYLAGFMLLTVALLLGQVQRLGVGSQLLIAVATVLFALLVAAKLFPNLLSLFLSFGSALRPRRAFLPR